MYNEQSVNVLLEKFGIEKTILYCIMESEKNAFLYDMHKKDNILSYLDFK